MQGVWHVTSDTVQDMINLREEKTTFISYILSFHRLLPIHVISGYVLVASTISHEV
jgi:hypothetical protein